MIQRHKCKYPPIPFRSSPFILSLFSGDMKFNFLFQNQFLFLLFVIFYFFFFCIFIFTEKIPPVFTVNPPVQMLISSGGKASMNCKASGFPIPVITWFKDGIPVPRAKHDWRQGTLDLDSWICQTSSPRKILARSKQLGWLAKITYYKTESEPR